MNTQYGDRMSRPKRILQVIGAMERAGVETWLMQVLRRLDRDRFTMDLLYNTTKKCAYDDEVRALGYRIIPCLGLPNPLVYSINFLKILRQQGPYDIVHSQLFHFGGLHLRLAYTAGVPMRILHSRNVGKTTPPSFIQRLTWPILNRWIRLYGTHLLAVNKESALGLYGADVLGDPRCRILPSAIDLEPFQILPDGVQMRVSLGYGPSNPIIGHIGRFSEQKNHRFILEIFAFLARKRPNLRFLLVGDGPLRPQIEDRSKQLGLIDRLVFTGTRPDVPQLLMGAMDVLLFPSKWEGSPRVLMEAQAAGLPSVISDVISEESDIVKPLIRRVPLTAPASQWAEAVLAFLDAPRPLTQPEAEALVRESPFNIEANVHLLQEIYAGCT